MVRLDTIEVKFNRQERRSKFTTTCGKINRRTFSSLHAPYKAKQRHGRRKVDLNLPNQSKINKNRVLEFMAPYVTEEWIRGADGLLSVAWYAFWEQFRCPRCPNRGWKTPTSTPQRRRGCLRHLNGVRWPWPLTFSIELGHQWLLNIPCKFHRDCRSRSWDIVITRFVRTNAADGQPEIIAYRHRQCRVAKT